MEAPVAVAPAPAPGKVGKRQKRAKRKPKSMKNGAHLFAHTLFVGQLPYDVSEEHITLLFARACSGPINVRLLTDKRSGTFKGMCFVDLGDDDALDHALSLHKTNFRGRRINVEPTRAGSKNSLGRMEHLKRLKDEQVNDHRTKINALVQSYVDNMSYDYTENDTDAGVLDFLHTISLAKARGALEEFAKMDKSSLENRSAYFMGVMKRIVSGIDTRGT